MARVAVGAARAAPAIYAAAVAGLGGLLLSARFVYVWAPVPRWVPGRDAVAAATGAVMVAAAVGLSRRRAAARASAALAVLFSSWLLLLHVPRIVAAPSKELLWAGGGQIATVVAGAWILFASGASPVEGVGRWLRGDRGVRLARSIYAAALPLLGFHHFADVSATASAVPAWLPLRSGWAWLTGAAHVAAGVAIFFGIAPRLAATLEAIMISAFVVLVHVPGAIGAPADRLQWTMLVVASVIAGAAWVVAGSYARDATLEPRAG